MAKMRTRRASLIKARDPLLELVERAAEAGDAGCELRQLGAAHDHPALIDDVGHQRLARARRGVALPAHEGAHAVADALRRHVAHQAREFLLDIRAQMAREVAQLIGKGARAADAAERNHRTRLGAARLDAAGGADLHAQRGKQRKAQLGRLAGKRHQPLARPALAVEKLVKQKAKGHRGGGLCRRSRVAQCICWMPASSQPLEPSAGLTRFHTSSKPTASVPGVSRTMPEKRTAAQCRSRSLASSSRSAFSATTSVCCAPAGRSRRSSSNISRVVNSRISSSRPASFASCSLMKFIFAVRRKPAVSKPAGTCEALALLALVSCEGGGAGTVSSPRPASCTGRGRSARRAIALRIAKTIATATAARSRRPSKPLPPKR